MHADSVVVLDVAAVESVPEETDSDDAKNEPGDADDDAHVEQRTCRAEQAVGHRQHVPAQQDNTQAAQEPEGLGIKSRLRSKIHALAPS